MRPSLSIATCVLAGLMACGTSGGTEDAAPSVFIAFGNTFMTFRSWPSFHSDGPVDDGTFPADVLGPRTQYINKLPPAGSHEFPIGTVIVESRENGSMKIFAGVKRGGGFNSTGAINWEWFELVEQPSKDPPVGIMWRGFGPPLGGDTYGGDAEGGCNACHVKCGTNNDFVCSPKLSLTAF
jgi:hypothetical protein